MKLHLGVVVLPYASKGGTTTGDVAGWLETKYTIMGTFAQLHGPQIAAALGDSVKGAVDSILMGAPLSIDPFGTAMGTIEKTFRDFLDAKEMDGADGIPTKASLDGVSPRFKRKRGLVRPSFIASGLYQSAFRAWMENG